jgi:hypothetical protein
MEQIPLTEEELRETQEALAELAALETNAIVDAINIDELPEQSEDTAERVNSFSGYHTIRRNGEIAVGIDLGQENSSN